MKHLTRDFLTMASASCPGTNMYLLGIFLLGCGGYVQTGQTNFDVFGSMVAQGISASINLVGASNDVFVPTGSHVVGSADVGRILVLKSQLNPRSNSGLFRVSSVDTGNNTLRIDYRAGSSPPSEQYMTWQLYVDESTASMSWRSGSNGTSGYGSFNATTTLSASTSRAIFRSPDLSSWQVRLCLESLQDVNGSTPSGFTIAPGFGGDTVGDFSPIPPDDGPGHDMQLHLHAARYYNSSQVTLRGMTVGLTPWLSSSPGVLWSTGQWRVSMIVDDVSGSCGIINRNVTLPTPVNSGSGWAAFGLCEDEQEIVSQNNLSDPTVNCPRLFVVGSSNGRSNLTWQSQFHNDNNMQVVGFGKRGYPVPGVLSCYSDISNPASHTRYLTSSADTPWMGATELLDVEVVLGVVDQTLSASYPYTVFPLQPRRLGRLPFFYQGRSNYAQWSTTTDSSASYYHAVDGVFIEWGGPKPTDSVSGSNFVVSSGSIGDLEGMVQFGAALPGSDPIPEEQTTRAKDIDATRFRKTYSYYRQVPVNVGYVKGGSNPSKP